MSTGQSGSTGEALGSSDSTLGRQGSNIGSDYSNTTGQGFDSSDNTLGRQPGSMSGGYTNTADDSTGTLTNNASYASRGVNPFIADIATDEKGTTTGAYPGMHAPPQEGSAPSDSGIPTRSRETATSTNTSNIDVHNNTTGDATGAQTETVEYTPEGPSDSAAPTQSEATGYSDNMAKTGVHQNTTGDATGAQTGTTENATGAQSEPSGYASGDASTNSQDTQSQVQAPPRPQQEVEDPSRGGQSDNIKSEQDKKDSAPEDSSETKEHKSRGETWTGASWVKFDKVNAGDPEISSGKELEGKKYFHE